MRRSFRMKSPLHCSKAPRAWYLCMANCTRILEIGLSVSYHGSTATTTWYHYGTPPATTPHIPPSVLLPQPPQQPIATIPSDTGRAFERCVCGWSPCTKLVACVCSSRVCVCVCVCVCVSIRSKRQSAILWVKPDCQSHCSHYSRGRGGEGRGGEGVTQTHFCRKIMRAWQSTTVKSGYADRFTLCLKLCSQTLFAWGGGGAGCT